MGGEAGGGGMGGVVGCGSGGIVGCVVFGEVRSELDAVYREQVRCLCTVRMLC